VREHGRLVPFSEPFWFAVAAFRPRVVLAGAARKLAAHRRASGGAAKSPARIRTGWVAPGF
jgi:hypothetical protein